MLLQCLAFSWCGGFSKGRNTSLPRSAKVGQTPVGALAKKRNAAYAVEMSNVVSGEEIESDDRPRRAAMRWLEVALVFAVFFVAGSAPVPHSNEAHYLCKAKQAWQPDWCAGDMFLESADAHLAFYLTVGYLTKWFSLTTVAWIGRVMVWALLAWAWQRLSRTVLRGPASAVLSAVVLVTLLKENHFAGEWVVGGVEGKGFAYGLVFFGLATMVEGRWRSVWPWLGLASSMHVLVGGWSVVVAAFVWLKESATVRPALLSLFPALLLGGVLALPGIVPALQLTRGVSAEDCTEANQIYVFDRLPHHLAPLTLRRAELQKRALRHGLLVLVFYLLWSVSRGNRPEGLVRLVRFAWASLGLSAMGFAWELACWNHPAWAASLLKYYWFRLADVAVPIAVCLLGGWMLQQMFARRAKFAVPAVLLVALLSGGMLLNSSIQRWCYEPSPADKKLCDAAAWQEACAWIRDNTPEDALFLVPRRSQTFNWNAHRRDLVTWKDVPQDAASLFIWRDRFFDVFVSTDENGEKVYRERLAQQGTDRIIFLADKYGIDYVLTTSDPPLQLPIIYANSHYTVYAIPGGYRTAKYPSVTTDTQ